MIPQEFDYAAPSTLDEALGLLANENAKALAGGMSLVPMMKLRFAVPEQIVDLGRLPGLNTIREEAGQIRIGAMATHYQIESSALLRGKCPLLPEVAHLIGDTQVRNMGTIGGSIAHADPAADYPAALCALEAKLKLVKAGSERTIPVEEFFIDTFTTALEPGELIQEIIVPVEQSGTGTSYQKVSHPASGFAIVGIAVRVHKSGLQINWARVGVTGLSNKGYRATTVETAITFGSPEEAAATVADGVEANSDLYAAPDYRSHLARVYTARAIKQALSRTA
jgi:aerobic carbon-monoxide dehydrogenase medium subunit